MLILLLFKDKRERSIYFRTAPKFVRIFLESRESVSLSSAAVAAAVAFLVFLVAALLLAVAEVGVAAAEAPSRSRPANDADNGVGACDPGVE
jgi:hypothetical protein